MIPLKLDTKLIIPFDEDKFKICHNWKNTTWPTQKFCPIRLKNNFPVICAYGTTYCHNVHAVLISISQYFLMIEQRKNNPDNLIFRRIRRESLLEISLKNFNLINSLSKALNKIIDEKIWFDDCYLEAFGIGKREYEYGNSLNFV